MTADSKYMQRALELAKLAAKEDEVPVGAVIVNPQDGSIIGEAYNLSEHGADITAHAEILAIQRACKTIKSNRLREMEMYVTLEPCTMCAAAISMARIANLYFGATDEKGGAVVSGVKFYESSTCHHRPNVEKGLLKDECALLLKDFFKNKRKKKTN